MLSIISLQILLRHWPVKYQDHLKHLKHISIKNNVVMDSKPLSINELKDALKHIRRHIFLIKYK